jgi:predicted TIM-barrel fold metal-dependent hydrolase
MTVIKNRRADSVLDKRLCIISCDTHVGPTMEQLRPYCKRELLDDFDAFALEATTLATAPTAGNVQGGDHRRQMLAHVANSGEHDHDERLKDMDRDGISAEVIFHGSQNMNPLPFGFGGIGDRRLEAEGIQIYNRWLADFCSVAPARHIGLAQLPGWDPEACARTVEWVRAAGLGGVNLPSMHLEDLTWPPYTDLVWEPFWSACVANGVPLVNHGASDLRLYRDIGPTQFALVLADGPWLVRRVMWWLMFGLVFERHPKLRLIMTEQPGDWPKYEIAYLQSVYESGTQREIRPLMTRSPVEIFHTNVFVGASFMSNREAKMFVELGLQHRVMWGSDYPHIEGSWPRSLKSLQMAFEGIDPETVERYLCKNATTAYGFELDDLDGVANRIGPTLRQVLTPTEGRPVEMPYSNAFRRSGAWS